VAHEKSEGTTRSTAKSESMGNNGPEKAHFVNHGKTEKHEEGEWRRRVEYK
jgi:hypothetical protein